MAFPHSQNIIQNSNFTDVAGNQYIQCNHQSADGERHGRAIADWLSDLDFKKTQKDILVKRTDGTGQWLLESLTFNDWLEGKSKVLWCPGTREVFNHWPNFRSN
jgi:hypothetical protein